MTDSHSTICFRLRLNADPETVFEFLSTDEGRSTFWAERTRQVNDEISFHFPNGEQLVSRILESEPHRRFSLTYFEDSTVIFELQLCNRGTDLCLIESNLSQDGFVENRAGWVSVLMNLKAQADFGVDLRNHDAECTWDRGYVDN